MTAIIAVDTTGLAYRYSLTVPATINRYNQAIAEQPSESYNFFPNLRLKSPDIHTTVALYDSYSDAVFNQHCGGTNGDTLVAKTVQNTDLEKIGNWQGIEIFTLKDQNHPLYKELYMSIASSDPSHKAALLPLYTDYIAKKNLYYL